jgi:hypothetical protein
VRVGFTRFLTYNVLQRLIPEPHGLHGVVSDNIFMHMYALTALSRPTCMYMAPHDGDAFGSCIAYGTYVQVCRAAFIGFTSSAVSDTLSNPFRVVKTMQQTVLQCAQKTVTADEMTRIGCPRLNYLDAVGLVIQSDGVQVRATHTD